MAAKKTTAKTVNVSKTVAKAITSAVNKHNKRQEQNAKLVKAAQQKVADAAAAGDPAAKAHAEAVASGNAPAGSVPLSALKPDQKGKPVEAAKPEPKAAEPAKPEVKLTERGNPVAAGITFPRDPVWTHTVNLVAHLAPKVRGKVSVIPQGGNFLCAVTAEGMASFLTIKADGKLATAYGKMGGPGKAFALPDQRDTAIEAFVADLQTGTVPGFKLAGPHANAFATLNGLEKPNAAPAPASAPKPAAQPASVQKADTRKPDEKLPGRVVGTVPVAGGGSIDAFLDGLKPAQDGETVAVIDCGKGDIFELVQTERGAYAVNRSICTKQDKDGSWIIDGWKSLHTGITLLSSALRTMADEIDRRDGMPQRKAA